MNCPYAKKGAIMEFDFETDEDTIPLLRAIVEYLVVHFEYDETQAVSMLNAYMNMTKIDLDTIHHYGAWETALVVHYLVGLDLDGRGYIQWRTETGLSTPPAKPMPLRVLLHSITAAIEITDVAKSNRSILKRITDFLYSLFRRN